MKAQKITEEIWKPIKYDKNFEISSKGRFRAKSRYISQISRYGTTQIRLIKERIYKPTDNGNGYLIVGVRNGCKRKNFYIHRLVAEAFIENYKEGLVVNHKDFDKKNNSLENLEVITQKENVIYSIEKMKKPKGVCYSSTKEKYIYRRYEKYRLAIPKIIDKTFATIEEAIQRREMILSEKYI